MVACLVVLTGGILIGSGATLLIIERFGGVDETYRLYRVLGEVVNQDGEPISNARAELWNSSSAITAVCTGQNGEFQLYSYLKVGDIVNVVIDRPRTRMESNVTITAADDDVIKSGF